MTLSTRIFEARKLMALFDLLKSGATMELPLRKKNIKNYSESHDLKLLKTSNYSPMLNWRANGETTEI